MDFDTLRATKDSPILHENWNRLVETVKRHDSLEFDASSGLQSSDSPVGRTVSFVAADTFAYIQLTQALPAGDGATTLGHGKGQVMDFTPGASDSANGTLAVASDAPIVDVYNLFNTSFKSGSTVEAHWKGGAWHLGNTLCSNAGS